LAPLSFSPYLPSPAKNSREKYGFGGISAEKL